MPWRASCGLTNARFAVCVQQERQECHFGWRQKHTHTHNRCEKSTTLTLIGWRAIPDNDNREVSLTSEGFPRRLSTNLNKTVNHSESDCQLRNHSGSARLGGQNTHLNSTMHWPSQSEIASSQNHQKSVLLWNLDAFNYPPILWFTAVPTCVHTNCTEEECQISWPLTPFSKQSKDCRLAQAVFRRTFGST